MANKLAQARRASPVPNGNHRSARRDRSALPSPKHGKESTTTETDPSLGGGEFGGPWGVAFIVVMSHCVIYYMWVAHSSSDHQGGLFVPSYKDLDLIGDKAMPTFKAWAMYLGFLAFELALAYTMPGVSVKGLPVPSENNIRHTYHCNGLLAWYVTLATVGVMQYTGVFRLRELADNLGSVMSVAVITGNVVSLAVYLVTLRLGKQTRMSGNHVYDFFMGAVLNPRVGSVDLKFFAEIRVSWLLLFLLTLSAADKQYAETGSVSPSMGIMVVAHWLYTNACMKGEECIPVTWDVFYEKFGWMLTWWNLAGVPFVYSFNSFYIARFNPHNPGALNVLCLAMLLTAYYIWDTAQSQKARFRMQLRGELPQRKAFPQLPWGTLKNPKYLKTKAGTPLLIDGWWQYAQKIHYTCDVVMALVWGLACGFGNFLPYFYVCFFALMITHRSSRDNERCRAKYGADWEKYTAIVPWRFVPYVW